MILPFVRQKPTLAALREEATGGVADWLVSFIDRAPGAIPERAWSDGGHAAVATDLRRFVQDTVTRNPVTRAPLSDVQLYLIELVLNCVDWAALARDPRFRRLDWPAARLGPR